MSKYKEIFKLKEMLEKLDMFPAPEFIDRSIHPTMSAFTYINGMDALIEWNENYQILIFNKDGSRFMSIIEGWGTYGAEEDKLEIKASFDNGSIRGKLTAKEVYDLILNNYEV